MKSLAFLALLLSHASALVIPTTRSSSQAVKSAIKVSELDTVLEALSKFKRARFISMRPDVSCIFEADTNLSAMKRSTKKMPSGNTILTLAYKDQLEFHIDLDKAYACSLVISGKTGGPLARILDEKGAALCTFALSDPPTKTYFDELVTRFQGKANDKFPLK